MNIGFDIDDTLTDSLKYTRSAQSQKYKPHIPKDGTSNYIKKLYKMLKEELEYLIHQIKQQLDENPRISKGAKKVLKTLKDKGYNIFIITRRFLNEDSRSKGWLEKNKLSYDLLIVNAGNKLKACKEHKIDVFIDNKISVCDNLNKNGIKAYLITTRFNKNKPTISPRVKNLEEFMNIILEENQELGA